MLSPSQWTSADPARGWEPNLTSTLVDVLLSGGAATCSLYELDTLDQLNEHRFIVQFRWTGALLIPDQLSSELDEFQLEDLVGEYVFNALETGAVDSVGVWHDESHGRWVVAANRHFRFLDVAISYATEQHQSAVWDAGTSSPIAVSA